MSDTLRPQQSGTQPLRHAQPPADLPIELDPIKLDEEDGLEPISLVESTEGEASPASKIRAFGVGVTQTARTWKRPTHANGTGAVRVRTFHGKLSEQGMDYMDTQINEWLDAHPDVEVKFVTSTVGQFEGKIREPALVLNVWY